MKLPHSVCEVLREHVVLDSECIDRMYLNVYVLLAVVMPRVKLAVRQRIDGWDG